MTDRIIVPLKYKGHQVGIATIEGNTITCEIHPEKGTEFAEGLSEMLKYGLADSVSLGPVLVPATPRDPRKV
jgi:hypothetical protein